MTMADKTYEDVIGFLSSPGSYGDAAGPIERIDTHGASIFLVGDDAWKVKRPVKLPYFDFSTPEKRRHFLERELLVNRDNAPTIYRGLVPVCRASDGSLSFGGEGEPVEWVLHMRRFPQDQLLLAHVRRDGMDGRLAEKLADIVAASHVRAPVRTCRDGDERIARIIRQVRDALKAAPDLVPPATANRFGNRADRELQRAARSLRMRGERGYVRRCHADLHLGNIVLLDGEPVLFDALEFDEELATIDVLYDLAFLIMDLIQNGQRPAAQRVLDRYLHRTDAPATLYGLAALPLFLALRAGVRALVTIDRQRQMKPVADSSGRVLPDCESRAQVMAYVNAALDFLSPPPAQLVAIGGLSGTGKTTLARALSPEIGAAPGAIHLRTDVERKAIFGVDPLTPLGPEAYTPEVTAEVYASVVQKAKIALRSGHSVVVDAVFARPDERQAVASAAERLKVPFVGLWLTAPSDTLKDRVANRRNDASDATVAVVERQLSYSTGPISWVPIDAGAGSDHTLREARRILRQKLGALV